MGRTRRNEKEEQEARKEEKSRVGPLSVYWTVQKMVAKLKETAHIYTADVVRSQ